MGTAYGPLIVTSGLLMYLDAANIRSYSGNGTTWTDLSGNANHGTIVNSPTYSSNYKGCFVINGTTQYFTIPAGATPSGTNPFSFSWWFLYTSLGNFGTSGFIMADSNAIGRMELSVYGGASSSGPSTTLGYSGNGTSLYFSASYSLYANTWYNIAFTNTGSSQVYYVNGVAVGSAATSVSWPNSAMNVLGGQNPGSYSGYMAGNFSIIKTYSRALTSAEITQNFNSLRYRYGI